MPQTADFGDQDSQGLVVTAVGLNKQVRPKLNILQDISLHFKPNEFIVIVGQSGGGKSTLLDAISRYRPATGGHVYFDHIDVYNNFEAVRSIIGYVPQRDIIHTELSVYQALDYASQLRLPRYTTSEERHQRIDEVLNELDLTNRKDVTISELSGGQQKRVSIGVELLTRPRLFFLDEPTSGLDPGNETSLMLLMRRLADQGRTIVMITHATKNIMLADKVVFLARGGYLAWFGPPHEALEYFDRYRSIEKQRSRDIEFDDIYTILEDPKNGSPSDWAELYRQHQAYKQYILKGITEQLKAPHRKTSLQARFLSAKENFHQQIRPIRQFMVLSARNLQILIRDRTSLLLMLLAPLLVGSLDLMIAPIMGRKVFDFYEGTPGSAVQSLFLLTLYSLMVSSLSQMREIVKEAPIYQRERLVNLRIIPYIASKIWVAGLMAAYHALAYTVIHYYAFEMPGGMASFWPIYITLFLASYAGMMLGLLASAFSPSAASAPMIVILFIIPNIVLSGALVSVPIWASAISSSHWAFRTLVNVTGIGADVASDYCWKLPAELRSAMTNDDKLNFGCRCMGPKMFDPTSCNFPGTGKFYVPELDQPAPQRPPNPGEPPAELLLPTPPQPPDDNLDISAVSTYLNDLKAYDAQVSLIQSDFKQQVEDYQRLSDLYKTQMALYQEQLSQWYIARSAAIGMAEGNIAAINERFSWAFISQDDPVSFHQSITIDWEAQGGLIVVQILAILLLMKRKDFRH